MTPATTDSESETKTVRGKPVNKAARKPTVPNVPKPNGRTKETDPASIPLPLFRQEKSGETSSAGPASVPDATSIIITVPSDDGSSSSSSSSSARRKQLRGKDILRSAKAEVGDAAPLKGSVLIYGSDATEEEYPIVHTTDLKMTKHGSDGWTFNKLLREDDFLASGVLFLEPRATKSQKNVKDNAYIFLVLEGTVRVHIHRSSYTLVPGTSCLVPRGNYYEIENTLDQGAKLFFCQSRKTRPRQDEELLHGRTPPLGQLGGPTSRNSMLITWIFQRLIAGFLRFRYTALAWYKMNIHRFAGFASGRRLYFLCFLLGLALRRLPFVGSPPLINIQIVPVLT